VAQLAVPPPPVISRHSAIRQPSDERQHKRQDGREKRYQEQEPPKQSHRRDCPPSSSKATPGRSEALLQYFRKSNRFKNLESGLADKMVEFWKEAGHDESTLRLLFEKHRPESRDKLRALLVSEIMKPYSVEDVAEFPEDVPVDYLLNETASFFFSAPAKGRPAVDRERRMKSLDIE